MPAALPIKLVVIAGEKGATNFSELAQSDNIERRLTKLRHGQRSTEGGFFCPGKKVSLGHYESIGARSGI
jgi:hypothetical protein